MENKELKLIIREKYIAEVRGFYKSDLIKIITGVRRCGKSVILEQIMDEIRSVSGNIVYLDFDDRAVTSSIETWQDIVRYVQEKRTDGLCYVFLDEVQEIEGWPAACRSLRRENCSVFITGSNSKLLSREFTSELSGRYEVKSICIDDYSPGFARGCFLYYPVIFPGSEAPGIL